MLICKFKENDKVIYKLDPNNGLYIVRDSTQELSANECIYHIELTTDSAIQFVNVPESYMTDTLDDNGKITPEASASS